MTFVAVVLGGLIAPACNRRAVQPQRRFLQVTGVLTALSLSPSVAWSPDTATRLCLVVAHLLAVAIAIPVLARQTNAHRHAV